MKSVTVLLAPGFNESHSIEETLVVHFWSQHISMRVSLTASLFGSSFVVLSGFLEIAGLTKLRADTQMSSAMMVVMIFLSRFFGS